MSTISASTIQRDIICFQVQALNNVDVGNSTSFGDPVPFIDTSKVHFNEGGFTFASNGVTFPETGYYVIGASLYYQAQGATNTNDRVCPEMRFRNITQDSNMGTNSIAAMGYIRNLNSSGYNGPRNSSSMHTLIVSLTAGDKIGVQIRRGADTGRSCDIEDESVMWGFKLQ